jgi:hypothetical protein
MLKWAIPSIGFAWALRVLGRFDEVDIVSLKKALARSLDDLGLWLIGYARHSDGVVVKVLGASQGRARIDPQGCW